VTWALFALTQNMETQSRLRKELQSIGTDNPNMEELNGLSYLDCVVRETLRVYPPVIATGERRAVDDYIFANFFLQPEWPSATT
jgi:cytochrome P450